MIGVERETFERVVNLKRERENGRTDGSKSDDKDRRVEVEGKTHS